MSSRFDEIRNCLRTISDIEFIKPLQEQEANKVIDGLIEIKLGSTKLQFEIKIYPQYPFQFHDSETIIFLNKDLIIYDHVNGDGSICIHTLHSPILAKKLYYDFESLRKWIKDYFIDNNSETHYEHIIVPNNTIQGGRMSFLFTEVNYNFKKGEFGWFDYSSLAKGSAFSMPMKTFLVQGFHVGNNYTECNWSAHYKRLPFNKGIYIYIDSPPVNNRRFIINNWDELNRYVHKDFLGFLCDIKKNLDFQSSHFLPIMIGYKISETEIHWQSVTEQVKNLPVQIEKSPFYGLSRITVKDVEINWANTKNCSYPYFFGRGVLDGKLTRAKILIVGVGAIGSMLATVLARGGCKEIFIVDYDIKEPENVCRSEYAFHTGVTDKVFELAERLFGISPFLNVGINETFTEYIKIAVNINSDHTLIEKQLAEFDYIFDCSADNDLAYILDTLNVNSKIINLSITNYAKELVCVVNPNLYNWMNDIYTRFATATNDLYIPTGCWSPTFKASYNDIGLMVQYAIKILNQKLSRDEVLRNFYLNYKEDELSIKLHQF